MAFRRSVFRVVQLVALIALYACGSSALPPAGTTAPSGIATPFVSAHRGGAAYAPEDTMTAYRNAARLGVDDFEIDTVPTKDGVLVLIHDDSLDRTTNCTGKVNAYTLAQLKDCDAGYWWTPGQGTTTPLASAPHPFRGKGVTVPTAQELFDFAKNLPYAATVTIEIKNGPNEAQFEPRCETTATRLVSLIQASGIKPRIVVQSFDPTCIDNVKLKDRSIRTLYLAVAGARANLAYCQAMGHDFSSPPFDTPDFNADFVASAHAAGVKTNPYTVDREADLRTVIATGTDGIITNFPACMMRLRGRSFPANVVSPVAGFDENGFDICGR
ncbi:MAG: glycerophosphodiester phosphodiesterase [Nevskia sp.]